MRGRAALARVQRRHLSAAAVVAGVLVLTSCTGGGGATPSPTSTATSTDAPTASGSGTTGAVTPRPSSPPASPSYDGPPPATASVVGASTLPAVEVGSPADLGDGLVVTVTSVRAAQLESGGPGDASGAGVAVAVELDNGTDEPVDLSGVTVTAAYGDDAAASSTSGSPAVPARGVLAPGSSGGGTWAFAVPEGERGSLVLTITSTSSSSAAVVRG